MNELKKIINDQTKPIFYNANNTLNLQFPDKSSRRSS